MPPYNKKNNFRKSRPFNRSAIFRAKPKCSLQAAGITEVDYKDLALLKHYVDDEWRIRPSRLSGVSQIMQRKLKTAIKRARYLALIPYTSGHHLSQD